MTSYKTYQKIQYHTVPWGSTEMEEVLEFILLLFYDMVFDTPVFALGA